MTMDRDTPVEVKPVAGHIGAEITGVDLAGDLDDTVIAGIRAAVLRWKVVFFRGQRLDHSSHVAFARRFGEPVRLGKRGSASPPDFPEVETTADRLELGGRYGMDHDEWAQQAQDGPPGHGVGHEASLLVGYGHEEANRGG
ncbi:TauD/TfdA dioxygenase family protein, partial [Streptomyces umbrinus]